MSNCDEIFQQVQALEAKKKGLADSATTLSSIDEDPKPERRFLFRGKDGQQYEANFDEVWKQISRDPMAQQAWVDAAVDNRLKPTGREGQFENFGQLLDQMGLDNAKRLGAMLTAMTGDWAKYNPRDFDAVTAVYNRDAFLDQLGTAFAEARINIDRDTLGQAISRNVAPFLGILNNQTKARVFAVVSRNNLFKSIGELKRQIGETGVAPTRDAKAAFLDAYAKAIFAHRAERIIKRRSGQLLQGWQRMVDEDQGVSGSLWEETGTAAKAEAAQMTEEVIALTPQEMVKEDSLIRRIVEAADKGEAGLPDIEQIELTIKTEGVDSLGDKDDGWESIWRRNARAAWKDSVLFNPKSQTLANYLSQKIVYLTEGYRRVAGLNGWELYGRRAKGQQLSLLGDDPEALAAAKDSPLYVNPLATGFFREALKAQLDGSRIAVEAALRAESVIKQSWQESLNRGFLDGDTPFAGNSDLFATKGNVMDLDTQYKAAHEVMNDPIDPKRFVFQLRDKLHIGLKLLGNRAIEAAGGPRLPVYSSLQMMTAVDQRAGLRIYMTDRANQLMLEQAAQYPDRTLKEWGDAVDQQLRDQLYQAEPSPQNIKDARAEFDLSPEDMTDDEVASYIASDRVGYPVLTSPEQLKSRDLSVALRMQQRQTGPVAGPIDQFVSGIRRSEVGDVLIGFWRSPFNQTLWDVGLANPLSPAMKVAQVAMNLPGGKVTPQMLAEAQASTIVWTSIAAMAMSLRSQGLIVGNGPLNPEHRKQWMTRLNSEGKVPNSVFGIPFNMGGIPVLSSIFLMVDAMDVIDQGGVSEYDQQNAFQGLLQVGAGQIMRMPGFKTVQMTYDAFANGNENAFARLSSWIANGQFNPASGVERLAEWATGTQAPDLTRPRTYSGNQDRFDLDQLPDDHPLRSAWNSVRAFVYNSNPGIAHWMGARVKETTWYGRAVRRPEGIFRGEWPIGVPGIYEFNQGEYRFERELERLGLLNPPTPLMTGKLGGAFMTAELQEEYNVSLGEVKSTVPFSMHAQLGGTAIWNGPKRIVDTPYGPETERGAMLDLTPLMDRATKGRTVWEAVNYVLDSREWRRWEANPATTTNPKVRDMTAEMRRDQPGPTLIKKIKDYYAGLAELEMEKSNTPAALQWKADKALSFTLPGAAVQEDRALEQTLR